mmetsp:Transcript_58823/g.156566  ORF Transcript_58823/g.156566 Transcript_58823/m.156566 type:complete len:213 (+) Transcript_58823:1760-2398(+)
MAVIGMNHLRSLSQHHCLTCDHIEHAPRSWKCDYNASLVILHCRHLDRREELLRPKEVSCRSKCLTPAAPMLWNESVIAVVSAKLMRIVCTAGNLRTIDAMKRQEPLRLSNCCVWDNFRLHHTSDSPQLICWTLMRVVAVQSVVSGNWTLLGFCPMFSLHQAFLWPTFFSVNVACTSRQWRVASGDADLWSACEPKFMNIEMKVCPGSQLFL